MWLFLIIIVALAAWIVAIYNSLIVLNKTTVDHVLTHITSRCKPNHVAFEQTHLCPDGNIRILCTWNDLRRRKGTA